MIFQSKKYINYMTNFTHLSPEDDKFMCVKFHDSQKRFSNQLNLHNNIWSVNKLYTFLSFKFRELCIMPPLQQWNTFCLYTSTAHKVL